MNKANQKNTHLRGGISTKTTSTHIRQETANKKFVKKFADKAHLSSLLTQNKTFALQRLMRDYNEVKNSNFSLYGVSAAPLDTDFYTWHGNLKALTQNIYKGCVIHIEIKFTNMYPVNPPTIKVLNYSSIKHPNIMPEGKLCLDMLETSKEKYKGWTSGYTVLSILLQLQNFFFDTEEEYLKLEEKKEIAQGLKITNEFNCDICPHKGSSNPWPEFTKNENQINTLSCEKYKEEKRKEYVCYHRKTTFEETPLGLGITIAKIPRSGEIRGIVSRLDYISLKSYTKEKLRKDMSGQNFTHWFPLYFGVKDEQFLHLSKRAISLIATGSTKNFTPGQIFKIIPKFFISLVTDITSENVINSSRSLKVLIHIYRLILFLVDKYPAVMTDFESSVTQFIENPATRHKDITSSLGDLLIYVTISQKHKIEEILPSYMQEQMDRQIFWVLQAIPELEKLIESSAIDDVRAKVCFKSFIVGAQILLFFYYFNKKVIHKGIKKPEEITRSLDENFGNITDEEIDIHQKEIQKILKIDNFGEYYKFLNLPNQSDKQINENLKQAYKNSAEKKYHGFDAVRFVPDKTKQLEKLFSKYPLVSDLINTDKSLKSESDPLWEKLVTEKFDLVQLIKFNNPATELTPEFVLLNYEKIRRENLFTNKQYTPTDYQREMLDSFDDYKFSRKYEPDILFKKFSWRKTYIKLYLELYLKHFNNIADFKYLYDLLEICSNDVSHLNIDVENCQILKSDYNYLRVVLSKLNKLEFLCLNVFCEGENLEGKLTKNLIKGFNNFKASNGSLSYLKIFNKETTLNKEKKNQSFWNILDKVPDIKLLDLTDSKLDHYSATKIRNHFYYFKSITTLILTNCEINDNILKEISDGMMKAKGIEQIYLNSNISTKLSSIINNLAFQPSLKILDISNNPCSDLSELKNSLAKMLKMSQSIEVLRLKGLNGLNQEYDQEFYSSLGDNNSLQILDLSNSGRFKSFSLLGSAIGMNSLKKGSLRILNIYSVLLDYNCFVEFVNGMQISEELHNKWYGNNNNAEILKDTKEFYKTTFYNSLSFLGIGLNNFKTYININDLKSKNENHIKILLENSKNLVGLDFSESSSIKYFVEMFIAALQGPNNIRFLNLKRFLYGDQVKLFTNCFFLKDGSLNENIHLEKLNLAHNDFGYSGIESLAKVFMKNKTLKSVNLYSNKFHVNGARRLSESLLVNNTLEILDIGYNHIRDLGFSKICEALCSNADSKLNQISFRCNFIKASNVIKNISELINKNHSLRRINLSNNLIDENNVNYLYKFLYLDNKTKINSDIFSICYFNSPERLDRCVWVSGLNTSNSKKDIVNSLIIHEADILVNENSHLGIPLDIKIFRGRNFPKNSRKASHQAFIEFIDPNSVNRILKLASTTGFVVKGIKTKVFKAGSRPDKLLNKKRIR